MKTLKIMLRHFPNLPDVIGVKIFMFLVIDANGVANLPDSCVDVTCRIVGVCQACAYRHVERSEAVPMEQRP